jgi:hypothetical protein
MTFKAFFAAAAVAMAAAMPASAMDAKIYPYHSKHNYCPDGLQPVSVGGVICCGQPNQSMTYAQMQRHPVAKRHKVQRASAKRLVCPVGEKGCFYR